MALRVAGRTIVCGKHSRTSAPFFAKTKGTS